MSWWLISGINSILMKGRIMKTVTAIFVSMLMILLATQSADATNGMNMIGYGARMSGMGGASLGMGFDTNLMNTNPAGIASIPSQRFDISLGLLMPSVHFKNALNDNDAESEVFPLPSLGYVKRLGEGPWTFGIGFYAQGGMGATYKGLRHQVFRNFDFNPMTADPMTGLEYHSNIAYMKLVPTVAYDITPELTAGFSLNVGYAMMEMKMPYSLPPSALKGAIPGAGGMTFGDMFGAPMDQGGLGYNEITAYADMGDAVTATGIGYTIGAQYKLTNRLTLGTSYTNKSCLDFSGSVSMTMASQFGDAYERMVAGALQQAAKDPNNPTAEEIANASDGVNQQLAGMGIDMRKGMAADYDAEIEFSWPSIFGIGASYEASDRLLFALDLRLINWKNSMKKFVMKLSDGGNDNINAMMDTPDGKMTLEMPLNWDNQLVVAFGAEYLATSRLALRAGFNFGQNPVPANTVIPIFPAVVENHLTLGAGYNVTDKVRIDCAYELVLSNKLTPGNSIIAREYDNSTSELSENIVHLSTSMNF